MAHSFVSRGRVARANGRLARFLAVAIVATTGVVVAAKPDVAGATSATLVYSGTTASVAENVVTSPTGVWNALIVRSESTQSVLRSSDGVNWQNIGAPTATRLESVAISDTGVVYAVSGTNPQNYYDSTDFWKYTTGWTGPVVYDRWESDMWAEPALILTNGGTLVGMATSGNVHYSFDDGATWMDGGRISMPMGGYRTAFIIGMYVHVVGTTSSGAGLYSRWSFATHAPALASTPPQIPMYHWNPSIFSKPGSTTEIWIASKASDSGLYLYHSFDSGATWSTLLVSDFLPANLPSPTWFSMGSDNRVHLFGYSTTSTTTTIYEASHGLAAGVDWTPTTSLITVDGVGNLAMRATQRRDGVHPDVVDIWASLNNPSGGLNVYRLTGAGTPVPVPPPTVSQASGGKVYTASTVGIDSRVVSSPTGTWRAVQVGTLTDGQHILRSSDGVNWEDIGKPTTTGIGGLAISDYGEVYATVKANPGGYYSATAIYRYIAGWYGPVVFNTRESDLSSAPRALFTNNQTLVAIASSGNVFYSNDDGGTWSDGGRVAMPGHYATIIMVGDVVHLSGSTGSGYGVYSRWSLTTKSPAPVTTPPAIPLYDWGPRVFSAHGSTNEIWIASTPSAPSLTLYRSTDAGATWTTVVSREAFPAGFGAQGWFAMGSDSRLHAYGTTWSNGTRRIQEVNRGLNPAPDWSPVVTPLTVSDPAGWSPSASSTQQVNGSHPGTVNMWFSLSNPASTSSQLLWDFYWVQRNGPPTGGALTVGETLGGGQNPAEPCSPCFLPNATNYPVTLSTGNFWHTFQDLFVPGRGVPLSFSHSYNSLAAGTDTGLGFGWTHSYGMRLAIAEGAGSVTVVQESGAEVTFALSGNAYTAAPRVQASLTREADGTWTFVRRDREKFLFDSQGRLTGQRDPNGYTTTVTRPNPSTVVVTEPGGRQLTIALNAEGRIASVRDQASPPRVVSFAYTDGQGNLTEVTDVNGGVTKFAYDGAHRVLTMLDPNQAAAPSPRPVTNHYDGAGRVDWQSDFLGRTTYFDYTSIPGATKVTDAKGNATVFEFTHGLMTSTTKGFGTSRPATWRYMYDPVTLGMVSVTDPNGRSTSRSFDARGNLTSVTDPLGRTTKYTYSAWNDVVTMTDAKNVTTTISYDAQGNILSRSTPWLEGPPNSVHTVTYHRDDPAHPGDVTSVTDPLGKSGSVTRTAYGDIAASRDALGNESRFCYDAVGRRTEAISPKGSAAGVTCASPRPAAYTTYYSHDGFGHELTATDPLGNVVTRTYDADGNLKTLTDAEDNTTTYAYDAENQLVTLTRADGTSLVYGYDADGNRTSVRDGGLQSTGYRFDDPVNPSHPTSITDALGRTTSFVYDAAGNRLSQQDPGGNCAATPKTACTTYSYDAAGQLTSVAYSDGTTPNITNIGYDAVGHRTSMTDGTGTSTWVWNSLGRVTSYTSGSGKTVQYGMDVKGQLTSIRYPDNVGTVNRQYDDAGRLRTVTDWQSRQFTFNYDANSFLTSQVYPNGTTTTFTPDGGDRLMGVSHAPTAAPGSPFASFSYGRDGEGQVTSVASSGVPADTHSYAYSQLNQLTGVDSSQYAYDDADNLNGLPDGGSQSFDAANELIATSKVSLVGTASAGSANTTSLTMSLPAGVAANDQILVSATLPHGKSVSTPTGYSLVGAYSSGTASTSAKVVVFRRTAAAGDSSLSVSFTGKYDKTVTVAVYRGIDPTAPIDAVASGSRAGGTSVVAPSVTTSASAGLLVMFEGATAAAGPGDWTSAPGMTERVEHVSSGVGAAVSDERLGPPGPTGTRTASFTQTAQLVGVVLALRPAQTSYAYDARGNRTGITPPGGATTTLGYDQGNRLKSFGSTATYTYNGDGLRMAKTVGGQTKQFTWMTGRGLSLLLADGANYYIYGPGGRVIEQVSTTGTVTFHHHDQLGSTRVLTDTAGSVVGTSTFDAYGRQTGSAGTASSPFGWAGEYRDAESGFIYLRSRYYDPGTAQFLTVDPLVSVTGSAYGYAAGNPLNATDPTGLCGPLPPGTPGPWLPCGAAFGWDVSGHHLPGEGQTVEGGRWYQPPKGCKEPKKVNNDVGNGWEDATGNVWEWDPVKGEWDVQHPDGSHTNIDPEDGHVTHGDDNFPKSKNLKKPEPSESRSSGGWSWKKVAIGAAIVVAVVVVVAVAAPVVTTTMAGTGGGALVVAASAV